VLREDDRGYQTVLVTDETDPYVDHWWPPGHVIGWEHTFVHENYEFLSAVAGGGEFEPSFEQGYKVQNSSTRSNAPTSAGGGCRWSSACRAVSNAGRAKWVPAGATLNRRVFAVVRTERLVRVERDGFPDDLEILVPGGVGYGHPIARLHDAVAGPRAELHRLVRVLAADVQLFGRNWFGTGRDDDEVCPLRLDLELRVRGGATPSISRRPRRRRALTAPRRCRRASPSRLSGGEPRSSFRNARIRVPLREGAV